MSRSRRVTHPQLESLWEALNANRTLATGYNKSSQARENSKQMWMRVERMLNSHGDGAVKDWKGWCKYWNDYKSKLKSKVAAVRASHIRTGGGPADTKPLTDLEKKFLQILGEDFGSGLPGVRVDPFEEVPSEQVENVEAPAMADAPGTDETYYVEVASESILQDHDIQLVLQSPTSPQPGPSTAPLQPPGGGSSTPLIPVPPSQPPPPPPQSPPQPPAIPHSPIAPGSSSTPRRSPRRRRRVARREPPMTQEMARRTLVQLSERNSKIAERNSQLLENLVRELREIKEILNSRLPGPPRDGV